MKSIWSAAVGAILVASLSGCTSSGPSQTDADLADDLDVLLGRADPQVARQVMESQLESAQGLVAECMEKQGFDYIRRPVGVLFVAGPNLTLSREEFARTYGFGFLPLAGPNAPGVLQFESDPNDTILDNMSSAEQSAWVEANDACSLEAEQATALLGVTAESARVIEDFEDATRSDARVVSAVNVWRTCMSDQGFDFPDPWVMRQTFQDTSEDLIGAQSWDQSSPRHDEYVAAVEREIAAATANLDCEPSITEAEDVVIEERRQELVDALTSS